MANALNIPAILVRAMLGDQNALNRLLVLYEGDLLRMVQKRLGPRLRRLIDAQDVLQETYLTVAQHIREFRCAGPESFQHWMGKIALHKIANAARFYSAEKRCLDRDVSLDSATTRTGCEELLDFSAIPVDQASLSEQMHLVDEAVSLLDSPYREVIGLRDYAGYSWPTVAAILGNSTESVARMVHTAALTKLASELHHPDHFRSVAVPTLENNADGMPDWVRELNRPTLTCQASGNGGLVEVRPQMMTDCRDVHCLNCPNFQDTAQRERTGPTSLIQLHAERPAVNCVRTLYIPLVDLDGTRNGAIDCSWPVRSESH